MKRLLLLSIVCLNLVFISHSQVSCANIIYVTPTGSPTGTGTASDPVTLGQALTLVTAARHQVNLLAGVYNYAETFSVPSETVLDGRYEIVGGNWVKNSSLTTVLNVNAPVTTASGTGHYVAVELNGSSNVYLKDITIINTVNASGTTGSRGRSVYGVHVSNSTNFYFTRSDISAGNASSGLAGANGAMGFAGTSGGLGHPGDNDDHNNCDDGSETNSGRGGRGGGNAIVPPASANQCNGATGNTGANGTSFRAGGNGGGGGSGERDDGATTRRGGLGGNGGGGATGGTWGNAIGGSNGCNDNDNGDNGNPSFGLPAAIGANGTTTPSYNLLQYFIPGAQAQSGWDGAGGAGGGGGGGGKGQDGFACNDGSGAGGSGGGGGGQGGEGGFGGFGGGGSFGVYAVSGNTGANLTDIVLSAGTIGSGGAGGLGGPGGAGGAGGLSQCFGTSGETGCGGPGGDGSPGGAGGAGAPGANGLSSLIEGATVTGPTVPNPFTVTASMFGGCTNSEIIINTSGGAWTLPADASYINDLTASTSSYNNGTNNAIIGFNSVGHHDLTVDGTVYTSYVYIRDTRPLPVVDPSVPSSGCFGSNISLVTPTVGAEYEWLIFEDGNTTATPIAIFSTSVANWVIPTTPTNTDYHVRLRVRDDCCGWSTPVYHTITGGDIANPILAGCPTNINASTELNNCGAFVTWTAPTATDDCGAPTVTASHSPGQLFSIGTTTVTYTASDDVGNTASCSFDVIVVDDVTPIITGCPTNISTVNDPNQCGAIVNWTSPVVSDNCPGVSMTSTATSGDFFPVGTTTVTYNATDAYGNTQTCSFDITVTDVGLPSFTNCPSNMTVANDLGNCDASVTWTPPMAVGGCASLTVTSTSNPGDIFPVGTTTVTYTADDGLGNTGTCSFDVIVEDQEAPLISGCPLDITISNDAGLCSAVATWTAPTESDNCAGVSMSSTHNSGDVFPVGTTTVTYTATDAAGNTSTCTFDVIVSDDELPAFTGCPTDITMSNDLGLCSAVVNWTAPTESDNCPGVIVTSTHNSGDIFSTGTTTVTYTATDAAGNVNTCSFDVIVNDSELPAWTGCPTNISQNSDAGLCSAIVNWTLPSVTDNCPGVTYVSSHSPGATFPVGVTTVTYTATDGAGNMATCSFDVTVADVESPMIIGCPGNITLNNSPGNCDAIGTWTPPSATDNCAGLTVVSSHNPGATFPIGTTTVTYTATDGIGNISTCTFDVTVMDTEAPTIIGCPLDITVNNDAGLCSAVVTWTAPTESDNCVGVSMTSTYNSGDVFPVGTTTVTYTATDATGSTASCSFDVTVTDTEGPTFTGCPTTINVNNDPGSCDAIVTWSAPVESDNCSGTTVVASNNPGDTFPIGTTTVTYTATDADGNQGICSFDVIVTDTELPVISGCPGNDIVSAGAFCFTIVPDYTTAITYSDNCTGATITQTPLAGTLVSTTTTINVDVMDVSGNVSTCSFDLVLDDQTAPTISCPGDQFVAISGACEYTVPDYTGSISVSDNCDSNPVVTQTPAAGSTQTGVQSVTITVTDANGNVSTCTFDMIPDDTEAPVISCPVDVSSCDPLVTFNVPTATDNCGNVSITQISGLTSGALFPVGTTTNTFIATDDSGNTSTCSFVVTIIPSPIVIAGNDMTIDEGDEVDLDPIVIGADTWAWSPAADFNDATVLNSTIQPQITTLYTLSASNAQGCTAMDIMSITVIPDVDLTHDDVDNVFTPNGDGKNDTWHVSTDLTGCAVKIYNTWGNEVFASDNYDNDWGGTFKGKPLPEGVYYYHVSCGDNDINGAVTIIRMNK